VKTKSDFPEINKKEPEGKKAGGKAYKVLVVDDSMFVKKQLGQILASEGFEVTAEASNGEEALEKYKEMHPAIDVVTMDITMPKMDGVTALEKIIEFDKDAKIIMVSALGKQDLVKKSFMLGAKNYIIKPLDRQKVLDRIVTVLKKG
jgi:two-component system, chemotaxis family, chemotaxis protein CheY